MEKRIVFLLTLIIMFFSCQNEKIKSEFYYSKEYSVLVKKDKNNIVVFCDPLKINKYSTTFFFGSEFVQNKFSKGYFLDFKTNEVNKTLFDTIYSNNIQNVKFKLKDSLLIVKIQSQAIGGEQMFPNNYNGFKMDTIIVRKFADDVVGFGFSNKLSKIRNEKTNVKNSFNQPFIVLKSNKKDSLYIIYKCQNDNNPKKIFYEINKGFIPNENVHILR